VTALFEAADRGDWDWVISHYAPDAIWESEDGITDAVGASGVRGFWEEVVVPLRVGGRARYTGLQVHFNLVHVLTGRDGKCTRLDIYLTESEALNAVGIEE
jgi:ketosteroid isomerase-like protein